MRLALAVAVLASALTAKASTVGSVGFDTPLLTEANAGPTGNINTASMFELESLKTTNNANGIFLGLPDQNFGTVVLDLSTKSIKFADSAFGSFVATKITDVLNVSGFHNFLIDGIYTPGTHEKGSSISPAEFRIGFTQTPAATGEISFSGTLAVQPVTAVVPELPTSLMFSSAVILFFILYKKHPTNEL